jgi:D-aminopeptidase
LVIWDGHDGSRTLSARSVRWASTWSLSHAEAKRQIEQAAQKAVAHIAEYSPWKITGPVEMTIEYLAQPPQQPRPRTVTYRGQNVLEAFEAWLGK